MNRHAPWSALLIACAGAAYAAEDPDSDKSVGVASMLANGTILVGIRGPNANERAAAVLQVEPGDGMYQKIIDHVGGLKPGETKPIPPWTDPPPSESSEPSMPPMPER